MTVLNDRPQNALQKCGSGLTLAANQREEDLSQSEGDGPAPENKKAGIEHGLVQKVGLPSQMRRTPNSGQRVRVCPREEEPRPTEGAVEDLFPLWFFVLPVPLFPCSLRKFLFLPCTQSLAGEDTGRRHHEWGPCGRQAWGPRSTGGSAEHTLQPPPRP